MDQSVVGKMHFRVKLSSKLPKFLCGVAFLCFLAFPALYLQLGCLYFSRHLSLCNHCIVLACSSLTARARNKRLARINPLWEKCTSDLSQVETYLCPLLVFVLLCFLCFFFDSAASTSRGTSASLQNEEIKDWWGSTGHRKNAL